MRFCPNCETKRSLQELFCEGEFMGAICGWDLSTVPIRPPGWQPSSETTLLASRGESLQCVNGHSMDQGDLLCSVCGHDLDENIELTSRAENLDVTRIDGWRLGKRLSKNSQVRERYLAVNEDDGRQGVLTLYQAGSEPDIAVYDVLRSLPRDHVPEIMAIGRWQGQAYEVDEELTGGTLADIGLLPNDPQTLAQIVKEIGRALHSFSEVGLRHRDL